MTKMIYGYYMPWVCPQKVKNFKANKLRTVTRSQISQDYTKTSQEKISQERTKTVTDEGKIEFCFSCNYRIYWMKL